MLNKRKIGLSVYIFLAIFQPPLLPVPFIYVFGIITVLLLMREKQILGGRPINRNQILIKSSLYSTYKGLFFVGIYSLFISCIDIIFFDNNNILINRFQCLNQLLILTGIELLAVWYILKKARDYNYNFYDIISLIIIAGFIQGICAILAYLFPFIRSVFTKFGGSIYENEYVWSRRGYGFSMTLLDTFGYGMGIIFGCALMSFKKRKLLNLISLFLCLFTIVMNARTGIVISAIAFILLILTGGGKRHSLLYYLLSIVFLICFMAFVVPGIISIGKNSDNVTLSWVADSMQELYDILFKSNGDITSATFLSNFTEFPNNAFELIFGSGHSVYGISDIIGFHSDVGYVNLIWTYGIIGGIAVIAIIISIFVKAFKKSKDKTQKNIVIFLFISYFVVQLKAILIGYNPGVMVTYIILFSLIYLDKSKKKEIREINKCLIRSAYKV